jgi:hypothetical protein
MGSVKVDHLDLGSARRAYGVHKGMKGATLDVNRDGSAAAAPVRSPSERPPDWSGNHTAINDRVVLKSRDRDRGPDCRRPSGP